ncbi:MAG: CAP domain-containing protein [Alsobacter sp.]
MTSPASAALPRRRLLGLMAALPLAACVTESQQQPTDEPALYGRLDHGAQLDANEALSLVNGHRAKAGLPPLKLDPGLNALARQMAESVAASDRSVAGQVPVFAVNRSTDSTGYRQQRISAGYRTLAEAFSGWRDSPQHNELMLSRQARLMGIAAVDRPGSKYRVYWALVVAG